MLLSLLTLIPLAVWKQTSEPDTPAELVEAFFQAVLDKDLEKAFSYTDASVPSGEAAAFLHPDAIGDDWEVLKTTESEGEYSSETVVRVTIGHPDGTAEGEYIVDDYPDELTIEDPFQSLDFANASQMELQVNDRVVERDPSQQDPASLTGGNYQLLPGVYHFFGGGPVALLNNDEDETPIVQPPRPDPTPEQLGAVQAALEDVIDDCLEYRLPAPEGCPFATDGFVDTTERERLESIEDVTWTVSEYPGATVKLGADVWGKQALIVDYTEPGRLELSGIGTADHEQWKEFTADCHFGGEGLMVLLYGDDKVELKPSGMGTSDTCRGTE